MHRFYIPPEQCKSSRLSLEGPESHHALHVVRIQAGQRIVVLDGAGHELLCEAVKLGRAEVTLEVVEKNFIPRPPYQVTLVQAIPKGKIIESIIQKATELGVYRLVPLLSERVVMHLEAEDAQTKLHRWRTTAIEALKQCGSPWLPEIALPVSPKTYLALQERFELSLIGSLQADGRHPRDYFERFLSEHKRLPQTVSVWVGPEGDFTPAELSAAKGAGALPITLGRLVLRTETAAIYCLSILNYELESKGSDETPPLVQ